MSATLRLTITVEERAITTSTVIEAAGGDGVLTISTALAELGASLQSTYIGARDLPTTIVEHLRLLQRAEHTTREVDRHEIPVTHARERCLLEHAARLQDHLLHAGYSAQIAVDEQHLTAAAGAYPPPR